jgi:endonuclease YncB( thermonuclease family)
MLCGSGPPPWLAPIHHLRMRNPTPMPAPARAAFRALALILRFPGRLLINTIDGLKAQNGVGPLNGFQRGAVHGFVWLCALIVFSMASTPAPSVPTTGTTASAAASTSTAAAPASTTTMQTHSTVIDDRFDVNRVIDGDTIVLADGRHLRVLGIDSCENHGADATPGGDDAKAQADSLLAASGWKVTLTTQPGAPDVDRDGRLLRYVGLSTGDYGVQMVGYDHTGIYQGGNDASQTYLNQLYVHDLDYAANPPSGRECGSFPPPPPPVSDDDAYVPLPDNDDDRGGRRFCGRWNPIC